MAWRAISPLSAWARSEADRHVAGCQQGARARSRRCRTQFGAGRAQGDPQVRRPLYRGVRNGPSPDWLQQRLRAVGLRPINAIVDITNLVHRSAGAGRCTPHDADKVVGQMVLRNARSESFDALDNKVYVLDETMTVIADDQGPLCLGGIMGGIRSGTTDATQNLFMECASWDPDLIARTGRKTGIVSDARYRLDPARSTPALTEPGLELATRLVLELCGGEPLERSISGEDVFPNTVVDFPLSEVERLDRPRAHRRRGRAHSRQARL